MIAWLAAIVAFGVSAIVVRAVERHAQRIGLIDLPNVRSSHKSPTPRGGGIGVIAGAAGGLLVAMLAGAGSDSATLTILAGAAVVGASGLWDDLRQLDVLPRLAVQTACASLMVWAFGGFERLPVPAPLDFVVGHAGVALAIVWIVGVTNFFNFMDGADGLAGGQATLTLALVALALWPSSSSMLAIVACAATLAFLLRNWAPARIFLGDVGSSWLGFLLAALPFTAPFDRRDDVTFVVGVSMALFLLDPIVTLVKRTWRRAPIGAAHREHAYQRLFDRDGSHGPAVGRLLFGSVVLTAIAAIAYVREEWEWTAAVVALIVFGVEWTAAARADRRRAVAHTAHQTAGPSGR